MTHDEKFKQRLEVAKMVRYRGLELRRHGHLFQIHSDTLGSLFQHWDIMAVKEWLSEHPKGSILTPPCDHYVDDKVCALKWGKVTRI